MRSTISWIRLAGWRQNLESVLSRIPSARSIRTRLFITLMIAGAPGVLFGAVEAHRQYQLALAAVESAQEAALLNSAAQLNTVFLGARQLLESLSGTAAVRDGGARCTQLLQEALSQPRYTSLVRLSRTGRTICSSSPETVRSVGRRAWFRALRRGADFAASPLIVAPATNEPAILLAAPVRQGGMFTGALSVGLRRSWLDAYLKASLGHLPKSVALIVDQQGQVVGQSGDFPSAEQILAAASAPSKVDLNRLRVQQIKLAAPGLTLVLAHPHWSSGIGLRSALIVLSPIMVSALSLAAVWLALQAWVLRWHAHLVAAARAFADNRPLPRLEGDPPSEIAEQALAFAAAVDKARAREAQLAEAVQSNLRLSRELHHRVKNNLQILSSLANRQQRRARDPAVVRALAEARAQLLAIALVYRFLQSPEEIGTIDLAGYLRELASQLDLLLGGDLRWPRFLLELEPASASADEVGALGLVVAECLIAACRSPPGPDMTPYSLRWCGKDLFGPWRLEIEYGQDSLGTAVDQEMIRETARQLKADRFEASPSRVAMARSNFPAANLAPKENATLEANSRLARPPISGLSEQTAQMSPATTAPALDSRHKPP